MVKYDISEPPFQPPIKSTLSAWYQSHKKIFIIQLITIKIGTEAGVWLSPFPFMFGSIDVLEAHQSNPPCNEVISSNWVKRSTFEKKEAEKMSGNQPPVQLEIGEREGFQAPARRDNWVIRLSSCFACLS